MSTPRRTITDLRPGDHLCLIYETEEEHQKALTPFLRQGLQQGEKVVYVLDIHPPEVILAYLREDGIDPQPYTDRGQLVFINCDEAYLREVPFEPNRMIDFFEAQTAQALEEGYPGLRITGEMSWTLKGLPGSDRLAEYEEKLCHFFAKGKCVALCQYDRRRFRPELLLNVLRTHPLVVIGVEVYENFYHVPPEQATGELARWLENLTRPQRPEERLRQYVAELELLGEIYESVARGDRLEETLKLVTQGTRTLFAVCAAAVYFLDEDGEHLLLQEVGLPDDLIHRLEQLTGPADRWHRLPLVEGGHFWQVVQQRKAILLDDPEAIETMIAELASEHPALHAEIPTIARLTGLQATLSAPLVAGQQVVGVLSIGSYQRLGEEDRLRFQRLTSQVSLAVEQAWARERQRQLEEKLETIHALGRELVLARDERRIAEAVVEAARRLLDFQVCGLWLVEAKEKRVVRAAHTSDDQPAQITSLPLDAERGIVPLVARTGEPLYLPDVQKTPRYLDSGVGTRSELCVPLKLNGDVLGVLNAESREVDGFDETDRQMLSTLADYAALALTNARLFDAARRRAEELAVLNDLGRALTRRLDVDEVLEETYRQASRLLDTTNFYIALYDPERDEVIFSLDVTEGELTRPYETRWAGQGLTEHVIRHREPVLIQENLPERLAEMGVEPIGRTALSWLGVPILLEDRVIGVIAIQSYTTPRAYDEHDRDLLVAIADQVAIALENAKLHQEVRRRADGLATVAEVAEQIESILDLDQLLQETVARVVERLGYEYAAIMLVDEEAGELVYRAGAGKFAGKTPPGFRQKLEEGMIGWVAAHGEALLARDVTKEPRYIPAYLPETRSELDVPLKAHGRVIGVLDLQSSQLDAFDQHDVLVMETLAGHLAVAIENAQLFQEEQRRREEAETLRDLASLLTSSLELDRVLETLLDRLGRAVPHDRATVMLLENGALRVAAVHGYGATPNGEEAVGRRVPLAEDHLLAQVVEQGEVVWVADTASDPRWYAEPRWATASWIGAPLTVRGLVIGMVSVARTNAPAFTEEEARLVAAVADHAAVAIENARLYQQLRAYADQLEERVQERIAELRRERERIQAILDHAGQGVVVTDARGVIQYVNPAAEAITGYTAEEAIGKKPALWSSGEQSTELYRQMWREILSGQTWRGELVNRRKDGTLYDAALTVAPIPGEGGKPAGFVGILEDITPIKELDRLKTQFISDAAHELRTPVTTIKLYVSLLQQERREEKRAEYLEMLRQETDLMVQLVQDLLDISRMEAGVARFEPEPVDLNRLAREVVERYGERARQEKIVLSFEPAPDLPPAMADREQIERVLTNLVTNALNYTPAGGQVVVRTNVAGDQVEVSVADTGYGIPEEEQKQIFERFFRGSAARRSGAPGTGLGLPIVREILKMHGGGIEVESQVGEGSTFTFWLPL